MRLACGEKPAREQLIDRENGGIRLIDMCSHPASHRCRVACHGVVVHQLGWRRHDLPSDDFAAVYDKRPARRTRVERDEQNGAPHCPILRSGGERPPLSCVCGVEDKMKKEEGEREKSGDHPEILLHAESPFVCFIRSILLDTTLFCNPLFVAVAPPTKPCAA